MDEAKPERKSISDMIADLLAPYLVEVATLRSEIDTLREQVAEYEASFELRWKAGQRAIKRWQDATGRDMTWPDHADLCVWLIEQLEKAEASLSQKGDTP